MIMRKVMFMALIILVGATLTATAADKKDKKKNQTRTGEEEEAPVAIVTTADSTSYAAGLATTRGLMEYLVRNHDFDTLFMADFKKGFHDAIERGTDPKYAAYNAGVQIAGQVQRQIFPKTAEAFEGTPDSLSMRMFCYGFLDGVEGDTTHFSNKSAIAFTDTRKAEVTKQKNATYIADNTQWLEENKTKEGVVTLPSGLQYKVITQGTGNIPTEKDRVTVRYEGRMIDGTVFDSSYTRDPDTSAFRPNQVIKGWGEALTMMPVGSKWELYIPQELAYGDRQAGKIKPFSTLIFTVEIVKID